MASATTDRRLGLVGNTAYKTPVTALATTNITQSGEQTVGGVAVLAINAAGVPDRVLCTGMTDATKNGIWDVGTGAWTRARDANGNYDLTQGTQVAVTKGTAASQIWLLTTANPITIGTTALAFSQSLSAGFLATLLAAAGSSLIGFIQAGVGAVLRTVQGKLRETSSVLDYGAVGDGVTNDTAACNLALAVGGRTFFPLGTYLVDSSLLPASNSVIFGVGAGSLIKSTSGDISQFDINGKSKVSIRDIGISATNVGTTGYVAGIRLDDSTDCLIEHVDFNGMSYDGVLLRGACLRNTVRSNYFHNFQSTLQDAADVTILSVAGKAAPAYNLVTGNWLSGGCNHGVLLQDPYTTPPVLPAFNVIDANFVGQHTSYGVALYLPSQAAQFTGTTPGTAVMTVSAVAGGTLAVGQDVVTAAGVPLGRIVSFGTGTGGIGTYNMSITSTIGSTSLIASTPANSCNRVTNNRVQDIQGSYAANRSSGMGVYIVGAGAGGSVAEGNSIANCCVQSLDRTLALGGIGVGAIASGVIRPLIRGNVIEGMTQGDGIIVSTSPGGAVLDANVIVIPATNNGTGAGGGTVLGSGIRIEASSNVSVNNPDVTMAGTGSGMLIYANGANCDNVNVGGAGNVSSAAGLALQVSTNAGGLINNPRMVGALHFKSTGANNGASLSNITGGQLDLMIENAGAFPAIVIANCTQLRWTGGRALASGNTIQIQVTGTNTGSHIAESVYWGTAAAGMSNGGTGMSVRWRSNAAPAAGTWAVGDYTDQSVPTVGQPKGWMCSTAGSPGTWTSEGNL